jgi:hypothetical protein
VLLLSVTALNDKFIGGLLLVPSFLAFDVAPGALQVLATTTGFASAFTTTVRVVDRVHTHTANSRASAEPASPASFATLNVHVLAVADLTDRSVALGVNAADFT